MRDTRYLLETLKPSQVDRAYLLMQAVVPELTLAAWRQAFSNVFRREEMVVATNAAGTVQGLCIYRVRKHEAVGKLLDVPFLVAASAGDAEGVAATLLKHMNTTARENRCRSIRIWTLGPGNWKHMQDPAFLERWDHGLMLTVGAHSSTS
ncbi:hypothetical protein HGP14_34640 [Rhizobium sp. P32RR-XVIII]|nr:hypothetical protein [Rhizobium sp. P32RR-XVIII]